MRSESGRSARLWLYGDVGCPWSYLALARIRQLAVASPVVVGWRPLAKVARTEGMNDPVAPSPAGAASPSPQAAEFESLGLPFEGPSADFDSRDALQALEFARDLGQKVLDQTLDGLFNANFTHLANLGEREELLDVCRELGLDREALELALEDGRYEAELDLAEAEAERYGIEQIPTILVGRSKIVGAAPKEVLATVVCQAFDTE
jgi:predicted DsbA family dithiol-disulfide isomerase